jgi:hypothetical protein
MPLAQDRGAKAKGRTWFSSNQSCTAENAPQSPDVNAVVKSGEKTAVVSVPRSSSQRPLPWMSTLQRRRVEVVMASSLPGAQRDGPLYA